MVAIHELPKWPDFRWDSSILVGSLGGVARKQGHLQGRLESLGFRLRDEAVVQTLTQDVVKSSEIEGDILDRSQVRSSIARRLGLETAASAQVDRHIEGVVQMMLDATQRFAQPLSVERLIGWHAALFPSGRSGLRRIITGRFRDDSEGPMQVVSGEFGRERVHFEAPPASRLSAEVDDFVQWFESGKASSIVGAAVSHLWFVTMHPFDDGNGRIARAIADMALARSEGSAQRFYSMSAQIRQARDAYYDILERTQHGDLDITEWLLWFIETLSRAIDGADAELAAILRKARFWEKDALVGINERQRRILNAVLDGTIESLTSSKYAKVAKCSQDTAARDINDLMSRGVLTKGQHGGRSTSYELVV